MIQPGKEREDKFTAEDLPKILAALHNAHEAKAAGSVIIHFADNGGVISVLQEIKKKYK